mgnify:CR=1 FL=1
MAASDNRRPSGGHTLFRYTAKDIDGRTVRGTMEAADVLYGVTMQEDGVSKILRLDLDKVSADLIT